MSTKRDQLVETAERLFYREGFYATGIDRVIAEAGVARMTLYKHFRSKDELVLAVLALRRLPWVLLCRRALSPVHGRGEAWFIGWFGPVGVAALFYCNLALSRSAEAPVALWPAVSAVIVGSVLVHGATAGPLTRRMGRSANASG